MGLMGRRSLPAGHALWLTGDNGIHMFFMRFPIDAVFLGQAGAGRRAAGRCPSQRRLRPWTGIVPLVRGADGRPGAAGRRDRRERHGRRRRVRLG